MRRAQRIYEVFAIVSQRFEDIEKRETSYIYELGAIKTMQFILTFICFIFLFSCFPKVQQTSNNNIERSQDFELVVTSRHDTVSLSNHDPLIATLINKTDRPMYLAKDFDIASNLFPNGDFSSRIRKSAGFYFEIEPVPANFSIIIENDILASPKSFIRLDPDASVDYELAITKQIEDFNKESNVDSLKVQTNRWYTLNLTYGMGGTWNKVDTFIGTVKARPFRMYLKP